MRKIIILALAALTTAASAQVAPPLGYVTGRLRYSASGLGSGDVIFATKRKNCRGSVDGFILEGDRWIPATARAFCGKR